MRLELSRYHRWTLDRGASPLSWGGGLSGGFHQGTGWGWGLRRGLGSSEDLLIRSGSPRITSLYLCHQTLLHRGSDVPYSQAPSPRGGTRWGGTGPSWHPGCHTCIQLLICRLAWGTNGGSPGYGANRSIYEALAVCRHRSRPLTCIIFNLPRGSHAPARVWAGHVPGGGPQQERLARMELQGEGRHRGRRPVWLELREGLAASRAPAMW